MTSESGRSIGEMLSVLAIMGVLSVVGLAVYKIAMDKKEANNIIHDGRTAHTLILSKEETTEDWTSIPEFIADTQKTFTYYVDSEKHHYIKVDSVEKSVCQQMVALSGDNLHFYKADGTVFSACDDDISMVIDYDNNGPIVECLTYSDCTRENAYCSDGQCNTCANGRTVNDDKTGCNCSADELTCSDEEDNTWCCGKNANDKPTICGTTKDECVESSGMCIYNFYANGSPDTTFYTDCSYSVSDANNVSSYYSDCYMDLGTTPSTTSQNIGNTTINTSTPTYSMGGKNTTSGCPTNQYCAIFWTDSDNDGQWTTTPTGISVDSSGKLYGRCQMRAIFDSTPLANYNSGNGIIVETDGCPTNQYCSIFWTESTWEKEDSVPNISAGTTGNIYGKCQTRATYDPTPLKRSESGTGMYKVELECPANQYCAIRWKSTDCTSVEASDSGSLYGQCLVRSSGDTTCPIPEP